MITEQLLALFAALFGAIVGSFLNVVILRLPKEHTSIVFPASHCPKCLTKLNWYENLPLLSYLFLRGKCSHCSTPISLQYPLVEMTMALLSWALMTKFGPSINFAGLFLFSATLLVIIVIDIQLQIIPDTLSIPGIVAGLLFSLFSDTLSWQSSLIGMLLGGGVLYAVATLYFLLRKIDGMGGGDIKLLAMIGAWLGYQSLLFVIFVSSLSGSIVGIIAIYSQRKGGQTRIPFGPFLSIAALLYMFFKEQIHNYFLLYLSGQWP
jgi:leader peptidase (prepilin peptidase)/N-methyltransferase